MKPKPFSSLNHFTVPVAICSSWEIVCCATREVLKATATNAGTTVAGRIARPWTGSVAVLRRWRSEVLVANVDVAVGNHPAKRLAQRVKRAKPRSVAED